MKFLKDCGSLLELLGKTCREARRRHVPAHLAYASGSRASRRPVALRQTAGHISPRILAARPSDWGWGGHSITVNPTCCARAFSCVRHLLGRGCFFSWGEIYPQVTGPGISRLRVAYTSRGDRSTPSSSPPAGCGSKHYKANAQFNPTERQTRRKD